MQLGDHDEEHGRLEVRWKSMEQRDESVSEKKKSFLWFAHKKTLPV